MTENPPPCPECSSVYTYEMGTLPICPECGHEWSRTSTEPASDTGDKVIRDAVGNVLADGDSVTVIKTLKVKGSPTGIKAGTKARTIRLVDGADGHDVDCKIDGQVHKGSALRYGVSAEVEVAGQRCGRVAEGHRGSEEGSILWTAVGA